VAGIKIAAYRKLKYKPKCLGCEEIIKNRKGNRLRCPECVKKHNKEWKKIYAQQRADYFRNCKNELRFGGNRQNALERDKYTCQKCGKTHHEAVLDVHHKDKTGRNKKEHNHSLENLITLCHSCHTKEHKEDTIMVRWRKRKKNRNFLMRRR
jgi:5-methylcytosine-specific restriction protein A